MGTVDALRAQVDQAAAALDEAKAQCGDGCADEAVHASHREAVEQAYAEFAAAAQALTDEMVAGGHALLARQPAAASVSITTDADATSADTE